MLLFLLLQVLTIGSLFAFWVLDPQFMNLNYYLFHVYPVFLGFTGFLFQHKLSLYPGITRMLIVSTPFLIWLLGVYYINAL